MMTKKKYKTRGHRYDWGAVLQFVKDNPELVQMAGSMMQGQQGGGQQQQPAQSQSNSRVVTGQQTVYSGSSSVPFSNEVAGLANAINSLSDKGEEPVEKVIGLPGKYYDFGGVMGAVNTGLDVTTSAFKNAKGVDTKAYEAKVKDFGNTEVKASSNDELLNMWGNRNYLNHVDKYDITGGNLAGDIIGGINSNVSDTGKGALAGFSVGGVPGAIIGGAVGLVGNALGQIFGAVNTAKKVKALNKSIDRANKRQDRAFDDAAANLKKKQVANMMYNYAAYGGPIYSMPYMSAGATGYDIAKDNAYARQMQVQTKNSTSFNPIFNSSGYEFADGGGIHIAPSKKGTFTAAAKKHGKSVQAFASQVLANPENYSPAMRKKANFARNAAKWHHAEGGLLMSDDFTNGVTLINQGGTHENNPHEGVQMGIAPDGAPNLVEEGEAIYNDYVFSNRLEVPKEVKKKYKLKGDTFAEAFRAGQKESEERPNDAISENGLDNLAMVLARTQEAVRGYEKSHKKAKGGHMYDGLTDSWTPEEFYRVYGVWPEGYSPDATTNTTTKASNNTAPTDATIKGSDNTDTTGSKGNNWMSYLRYAEPLANLGAVASDLMGLTNTPTEFDYIPAFQAVGFNPLGNYIPVTHFDTRYAANQAAQQAAATRAALMQSSSPSKWANILAADYNAQIALGDLLRQGALQDYQMMIDREQFNRGTNQMNSEMGLKAEMANQEQRLKYAQAALQQAKMNEDNSNIASAARAANLSALAESTANIGREADARNDAKTVIEASGRGLTVAQIKKYYHTKAERERIARAQGMSEADIKAANFAYGGSTKKRKKGMTFSKVGEGYEETQQQSVGANNTSLEEALGTISRLFGNLPPATILRDITNEVNERKATDAEYDALGYDFLDRVAAERGKRRLKKENKKKKGLTY